MRTLTPLVLLPLVVLAPLLMAPAVYATEVEPRPTVLVAVHTNELVEVGNPDLKTMLALFAIGAQGTLSGQGTELLFNFPVQVAEPGGELIDTFHTTQGRLLTTNVALFVGVVTRSNARDLLRTPVTIEANATDGGIIFVFGPIPSGRLAGQTFTFKGVGTVIIVCLDCRGD